MPSLPLLRRQPRGAFAVTLVEKGRNPRDHRTVSLGSDGLSASLPPVEFGPSRRLYVERRRRRAGKQTKIFLKKRQRRLRAGPRGRLKSTGRAGCRGGDPDAVPWRETETMLIGILAIPRT